MKKLIFLIILVSVLLVGCGSKQENQTVTAMKEDTVSEEELKASDTAVLIRKNTQEKKVTFQTLSTGARYDLTYTGTTQLYDKYGQAIVMDQVELGEIVDIIISLHSKALTSLNVSSEAFTISEVENQKINEKKGMFSLGSDNYKITDNLVVVTGDTVGEIMDLNEEDTLTVKGIGRQIYSVILETGHGYVRLKGDEYFQGGWVEIGKIIKPITTDMLLLVPEGAYDMRITYHGFGGSKSVKVDRDKETVVDVSDLKGELLKIGKLSFHITPSDATLYINGEKTDYNQMVELEYGVYQMVVTAKDYTDIKKYLSVGKEMAEIEITMEEKSSSSSSSSKSSKSSSNSSSSNSLNNSSSSRSSSSSKRSSSSSINSNSGKAGGSESIDVGENEEEDVIDGTENLLYIDSPEDVEVYYDGIYKGIAPLHFTKSAGTHVITLKLDGYETKSYTITLDSSIENETYSFNDLVAND
ncbi:MAG: PEGA domain-containing protein [Lachnospiraceae bacterium]|nr:PEGA domain-containing protein [Lachnospiraceae bacterium]